MKTIRAIFSPVVAALNFGYAATLVLDAVLRGCRAADFDAVAWLCMGKFFIAAIFVGLGAECRDKAES